ncbi:MAG: archease [Planctomycetia bacterium]|nr:archease [Planctomycetia bacterium]
MHEVFEHTADLGLRIRAADLPTLFAEAAAALFAAIVEDLNTVRPEQRMEVELPADEREYLLFDWLNELLYRYETQHLLCNRFEVKLDEAGLHGIAWGEPLDRDRHALSHEVKAITYHALKIEPTADGWLAEIIVDI